MDKYQKFALKCTLYCVYEDKECTKIISGDHWKNAEDGHIVIKQLDNYNITKYYLRIDSHVIKSVIVNGKKIKMKPFKTHSYESAIIEVDFNNRIKELTIEYNDVIDPITIPIIYIESDHKIYDAEIQKQINQSIKPEHKVGVDLVNIYWNLVNDKVEIIKINLYLETNGDDRLIGKYKEKNTMFKSITGLAFGNYLYEIIELDAKENEIARTDKIPFIIK